VLEPCPACVAAGRFGMGGDETAGRAA